MFFNHPHQIIKASAFLHPVYWVARCDILAIMVGIFLITIQGEDLQKDILPTDFL